MGEKIEVVWAEAGYCIIIDRVSRSVMVLDEKDTADLLQKLMRKEAAEHVEK